MSDDTTITSLETVVRTNGLAWMIDSFGPSEEALIRIQHLLDRVNALGRTRLGSAAPDLTEGAIVAEYGKNPHKVVAFLQGVGASQNPEMLLMAWRVIQGMQILRLSIEYEMEQKFRLSVALESPYGGHEENYESHDIDDAALLRHLGVMKIDGRPLFDGFYPLRLLN